MLWTSRTTVHDLRAIAEMRAASWQHACLGILPDTSLLSSLSSSLPDTSLSYSPVDDRDMQWMRMLADPPPRSSYEVLKRDGRVIGYVGWGACQDAVSEYGDMGEIYGIYLRSDEWGKGIGNTLVNNALRWLRRKGFSQVRLWVPEESERLRQLYEYCEFELASTTMSVEDNGKMITLVRYWRAL